MPFEQVFYMFDSDTPQDDLLFKVYIRNLLVLFKLWELYYLQARNSKQILFHMISYKAVSDGRLFSCLRLFEYNRAFFKVFIRNLLVLFKL